MSWNAGVQGAGEVAVGGGTATSAPAGRLRVVPQPPAGAALLHPIAPGVTFADVHGLGDAKARLRRALLATGGSHTAPWRRGGVVLYGPPDCGKAFVAQALAGELGVGFAAVNFAECHDPAALRELFAAARGQGPCLLFLDDVDAANASNACDVDHGRHGRHGRSDVGPAQPTLLAGLLDELDADDADRDQLFVIAATSRPWDVDPALRRRGRLGRAVFAAPPDAPAREALLAEQLRQRPTRDLDLACLVARTAGCSNADLRQLMDSAARRAVATSLRTGQLTPVDMWELKWALRATRPATAAWFARAQQAADGPGDRRWYDQLRDYLLRQSVGAATGSMPRSR